LREANKNGGLPVSGSRAWTKAGNDVFILGLADCALDLAPVAFGLAGEKEGFREISIRDFTGGDDEFEVE
jgi:hypothetical protein